MFINDVREINNKIYELLMFIFDKCVNKFKNISITNIANIIINHFNKL